MIRTIAGKEIHENVVSFKFAVITLLVTMTVLASMFIMYRDYQLRIENYEILRPSSKEPIAIVSPTPLSIFVKGLDETIGRSYRIWFGGQIQVGSNQQSVNTLFRLFTTPDLLYIIKVVMSLCAILYTFDMISGEKESRTLSLSLANHLKRTSLIIGKWIGGFTCMMIPLLIALLIGIIVISSSSLVQMRNEEWLKLGMFLCGSVLYLAFFYSLGLYISCIAQSSASSLVLSLFVWALVVFVLPNLGNTLARQFVEIPSVQQLEVKREHIWVKEVFEVNQKSKQGTMTNSSLSDMLGVINSENDKLIVDYRTRFRGLVNLSKNITRLSPSAAFTFLSTELMGTGIGEEQRVKEAVLRYKNAVWNQPVDSGGNILGEFPAFSYERSSVTDVVSGEGFINIMILVLFTVISFAFTYVAFLRYDVR